ncbi:MAG: nucleotidyltransferase family protein [Bacteroidia bacterium]
MRKPLMSREAIILAGGFGTRLKDVVSDVPKPMAPVNTIPFLNYMFRYLHHYNIEKVILSVGYLSGKIMTQYQNNFNGIDVDYAVETEPLGTGGGIRLALEKCHAKDVLVLNGDSFFDINLNSFYDQHGSVHADCSLALRQVDNAARFGTIKTDGASRIKSFREKTGEAQTGLINAGVYLLEREIYFDKTDAGINFSIEKDFFEKQINELKLFGFEYEGYFIDIGVPEDYKKAQHDFEAFKY